MISSSLNNSLGRLLTAVILVLFTGLMGADASAQQDGWFDLPAIDRPAVQTDQGAGDLAIVVAIEDYHNLSGIPGAELSGLDWQSFFTGQLGMPSDNVLFLRNHQALPSSIQRRVTQHLERATSESRVWFVFIGHGAPYQAVGSDGTQESDGLLVGVAAFNDSYEDFVDGSLRKSELEALLAGGLRSRRSWSWIPVFQGALSTTRTSLGPRPSSPAS